MTASERAPTLSFLHKDKSADEVGRYLGGKNVCTWSGHFYAIRATEVLGLAEKGGVTRMGISVYNTMEDIDRTLQIMEDLK